VREKINCFHLPKKGKFSLFHFLISFDESIDEVKKWRGQSKKNRISPQTYLLAIKKKTKENNKNGDFFHFFLSIRIIFFI